MVEQKATCSPPHVRVPKSQLTVEQSLKRGYWKKKGTPSPKTKEKPQREGRGTQSRKNQISYLLDRQPTNWKTIIPQKFFHGSENSKPQAGFPASSNWSKSPQRIWLLRPAGFDCKTSKGLEETESPLLEGTHKVSCTPVPSGKQQ